MKTVLHLAQMDEQSVQRCEENGIYTAMVIGSHSDPTQAYNVLVIDAEEPSDTIWECEGFMFRGSCSHQQEALDQICMWTEVDGPEQQVGSQRRNKICPRCGGPTEWITNA